MKIKKTLTSMLTAGLVAAWLAAPVSARIVPEDKAKVSRADAEKTALTKVPGGKVKDAELEEEDGKLIWSFDIETAGTKALTEVEVDATTGEVLKVGTESDADEKSEKKEEKEEDDKNGKK